MFNLFRTRKKTEVVSTPLSEFIRHASSAKKKQVYVTALKRASDAQNEVVSRSAARRRVVAS